MGSQGHHPAMCLVERLEARHCPALEGEKRANTGGAIGVRIILKKKKKEKKQKNSRGVVFKGEQFCHPRDIWKHFWLSQLGDCYKYPVGRSQHVVAQSPARHSTVAPNKGLSIPRVSSATVKKHSSRETATLLGEV